MQRRFVSYKSTKDTNIPPESSQGAPRGAATVADGLMEQGGAGPRQPWRSLRTVTTKADGDVERWPFRAGRPQRSPPPGYPLPSTPSSPRCPSARPQAALAVVACPALCWPCLTAAGSFSAPGPWAGPGESRVRDSLGRGACGCAPLRWGKPPGGSWAGLGGGLSWAVGQGGQGGVLGVVMAEWPGCQGRPAPLLPWFSGTTAIGSQPQMAPRSCH